MKHKVLATPTNGEIFRIKLPGVPTGEVAVINRVVLAPTVQAPLGSITAGAYMMSRFARRSTLAYFLSSNANWLGQVNLRPAKFMMNAVPSEYTEFELMSFWDMDMRVESGLFYMRVNTNMVAISMAYVFEYELEKVSELELTQMAYSAAV